MALRRISYNILRSDSLRTIIKSYFCGIDLGEDKSFKTQYKNFRNCRFDDYLNELKSQYNYPSHSEVLIFYKYCENNNNKKFLMHHIKINTNLYSVDYVNIVVLSEEEILERNRILEEGINLKTITDLGITASVETMFFKNIPLNFGEFNEYDDDEDDDDEDENNNTNKELEFSFIHEKCSVCLESKPDVLLIPCLHIALCKSCNNEGRFTNCPVCREKIDRKIVIRN